MSDPETATGQLTPSRRGRDRLARFDPTVTMGALLQMGLILAACIAAYGTYSADKAKTAMEVAQIKVDATRERTEITKEMGELRGDVKDVQRSLIEIDKGLALLKARSEPQPPRRATP